MTSDEITLNFSVDIKVNLEVKFTKAIPVAPTHIYHQLLLRQFLHKCV